MTAKCRSGDFRDSDRDGGGAGSAADADVVEPGAGVGGRITVAKLFAELRPEPSEDVSSLAAVGEGLEVPARIVSVYLNDGPFDAGGENHANLRPR